MCRAPSRCHAGVPGTPDQLHCALRAPRGRLQVPVHLRRALMAPGHLPCTLTAPCRALLGHRAICGAPSGAIWALSGRWVICGAPSGGVGVGGCKRVLAMQLTCHGI